MMAQQHRTAQTPRFADAGTYERARRALTDAGYTGADVRRKLGGAYHRAPAGELPVWLERTRGGEPVDHLIRLFLIGLPLPEREAAEALAPLPLETWERAGLLRRHGADQVAAPVALTPYEHVLVASDRCGPLHRQAMADEVDHVLGVGPSSALLALLTMRHDVERALDLCCGSGVQALLLARHAAHVTASDFNPRALAMAQFNARLNGIENVRWVHGSFLEPIARQPLFDLIVSVPPYVISPGMTFRYRDSGAALDRVCPHVLRGAAARLRTGGFAQMLCQWVHVTGERWEQRVTSWFDGIGCDALVVKMQTQEPAAYAAAWAAGDHGDVRAMLEQSEAWLAYYREQGVEAISSGVITLRRRDATAERPNWVALRDPPDAIHRPCGGAIRAMFDARDLLDALDPPRWLQLKLRCAPGVRLSQELTPANDASAPAPAAAAAAAVSNMRLIINGDWVYSCRADGRVADLLAACDGARPLAAILAALAPRWGVPADAQQLLPGCISILRELIEFGALAAQS